MSLKIPKLPSFSFSKRTTLAYAVFLAKVWGIDANEWNDFGVTPSVKPTSGSYVTVGEITLDENSTLTLTTSDNPTLNQQYFDGDLFFNDVKFLENQCNHTRGYGKWLDTDLLEKYHRA